MKRVGLFYSLLDLLGWALDVARETHLSSDTPLVCGGPFDGR